MSNSPEIKALTVEYMTEHRTPGIQLAIWSRGETVFSEGFGLSDVENNVPVTPETVFRIASISKPITACSVLSLRDAGLLDIDKPAERYVKNLPKHLTSISARQLLTHTSGIRCYENDLEAEQIGPRESIRGSLDTFASSPLVHSPGEKFLYSTFGYNLLGMIAEGASDLRFEELLKKRVFLPSGMGNTQIDAPRKIMPFRARGYYLDRSGDLANSKFVCNSYKIPGGGLVSNAEDLMKFASSLFSGALLDPETVRQMWSSQFDVEQNVGSGFGWTTLSFGSFTEVYHTGSQHQVRTVLYIVPEIQFATAVLTNLESGSPLLLARSLGKLHQIIVSVEN